MVGIVMISHCNVAAELYRVLEFIIGAQQYVEPVGFHPGENKENFKLRVKDAVLKVYREDGVLILVDKFGEIPCNTCIELIGSELKHLNVDFITGLSLPMVLLACKARVYKNLNELVCEVKKSVTGSTIVYSEMVANP
ncbi:PTS system, mannose-specific IIA component [Caldanaerovirga acetigignens]|uniref:PTS system, mannose-specific IIA component n=1 Tax=Caldanaerovirga acetigignens TaxID=447595 RepID=A0A1M7LT11_9FIRM|nr:hypothetical protein [Caldanaerovirga acetigignens]SHM81446.1 PTS system, mannose-specific IIA component [Caldanaerovirga acetigignens]